MNHIKLRAAASLLLSNFQPPGVEYPPAGINREALPLWQETLHQYSGVIFDGTTSTNWADAITLFEAKCRAKGIRPWA